MILTKNLLVLLYKHKMKFMTLQKQTRNIISIIVTIIISGVFSFEEARS